MFYIEEVIETKRFLQSSLSVGRDTSRRSEKIRFSLLQGSLANLRGCYVTILKLCPGNKFLRLARMPDPHAGRESVW